MLEFEALMVIQAEMVIYRRWAGRLLEDMQRLFPCYRDFHLECPGDHSIVL